MIELSLSPHNEKLQVYKTQKMLSGQYAGCFIADGEKAVLRLLESSLEVVSIILTHSFFEKYHEEVIQKIGDGQVYIANKADISDFLGYRIHQGIMALGKIPPLFPYSSLSFPILALNRVMDAENVGAIVRTALAFGVTNLLIDTDTCHPYIRRAVRSSMGHVFSCKISKVNRLDEALSFYRSQKGTILGTGSDAVNTQNIYSFQFPTDYVLVLGNEGEGMDSSVLQLCDSVLKIPMQNSVNSLNVATAASVFLFKANNDTSIV
jgi:tRNA G18 (ribose-2'-O)-methylase SpoU